MDSFINALARAQDAAWPQVKTLPLATDLAPLQLNTQTVALSAEKLKAHRVVSFDGADKITRAFDVLRNVCLKDLAPRVADRPIFGVTSPSAGSGASTTAINLAFSLARLQKGAVMLADLSPPGEEIWQQLRTEGPGPAPGDDRISLLEVAGTTIHAASLRSVVNGKSGDEIKEALRSWAAGLRRDLGQVSIVLDLPPLLSDDRVGSLISEIDMIILVLATGKSRMAELETSKSYLHDATRVQLVLNKARDYDL